MQIDSQWESRERYKARKEREGKRERRRGREREKQRERESEREGAGEEVQRKRLRILEKRVNTAYCHRWLGAVDKTNADCIVCYCHIPIFYDFIFVFFAFQHHKSSHLTWYALKCTFVAVYNWWFHIHRWKNNIRFKLPITNKMSIDNFSIPYHGMIRQICQTQLK